MKNIKDPWDQQQKGYKPQSFGLAISQIIQGFKIRSILQKYDRIKSWVFFFLFTFGTIAKLNKQGPSRVLQLRLIQINGQGSPPPKCPPPLPRMRAFLSIEKTCSSVCLIPGGYHRGEEGTKPENFGI
jgi:hypothetical protein